MIRLLNGIIDTVKPEEIPRFISKEREAALGDDVYECALRFNYGKANGGNIGGNTWLV